MLPPSTYSEIVWPGAGWTAPTWANAKRTTGLPNSYASQTDNSTFRIVQAIGTSPGIQGRRSRTAEAPHRRVSDGTSGWLRYLLVFHPRLAHSTYKGKPSRGDMMDTPASLAPPDDGSATTTAPPREEPDTPAPPPPDDGSATTTAPPREEPDTPAPPPPDGGSATTTAPPREEPDTPAPPPPDDGSATTTAPPREEPDTPAPPPPDDGPSTIDAIEGPVWVAWREGTLTRAKELEALSLWVRPRDTQGNDKVLAEAIDCHLDAARQAAKVDPLDPPRRFRIFRNGPLIERAKSNLDAAEAHLLSTADRTATYLVKCPACSTMCSVISLGLTRDDRSLSGSPGSLASRIPTIRCSRRKKTKPRRQESHSQGRAPQDHKHRTSG